ncbi:MAG: hypothetical protein QF599_14290, partial [Planctomycetota bacterium]|jgi:hypothetical protein|nr:hypothetical protein [Planctomycetota bacterium]
VAGTVTYKISADVEEDPLTGQLNALMGFINLNSTPLAENTQAGQDRAQLAGQYLLDKVSRISEINSELYEFVTDHPKVDEGSSIKPKRFEKLTGIKPPTFVQIGDNKVKFANLSVRDQVSWLTLQLIVQK